MGNTIVMKNKAEIPLSVRKKNNFSLYWKLVILLFLNEFFLKLNECSFAKITVFLSFNIAA